MLILATSQRSKVTSERGVLTHSRISSSPLPLASPVTVLRTVPDTFLQTHEWQMPILHP
jgi:hypothetical protein